MRARGCHVYNMAGNLAGSTHARTLYLLHRRCLIFTVVFISRRTVTIIATDSKGVTLKRTTTLSRECNEIHCPLSYLQTDEVEIKSVCTYTLAKIHILHLFSHTCKNT